MGGAFDYSGTFCGMEVENWGGRGKECEDVVDSSPCFTINH